MKQRIITALIMIAVIFGSIFFEPLLFLPLVAIVFAISIWEWCKITKLKGNKQFIVAVPSVLLCLLAIKNDLLLNIMIALSVAHYFYAVYLIVKYEKDATFKINDSYLLCVAPILLSSLIATLVYIFNPLISDDISDNAKRLMFIVMVVAAADTGAYFVGYAFGKHKLSPRVSPKKTIEGLIGGLLSVVAVVFICGFMVDSWFLSAPQLLVISIVAALFSVVGDLFISIIKRQHKIKDSSNILPGHGGVLDRIDGLLAGVPVFYLFVLFAGAIINW